MNTEILLKELAREIRTIYKSDLSNAEIRIETHIGERLRGYPPDQRLAIFKKLSDQFTRVSPEIHPKQTNESEEFSRLFPLLLGKKISLQDFSSSEISEKLASSLNTIFDMLNEIVGVINTTLLGKKDQLETIRQIIGSDLESEVETGSLQKYLEQIKKAFLVAHKAFRQATQTKISEIFDELDPDRISALAGGGLKFGPLRKAELYEIYREKFGRCKSFFESGHLIEEFTREFEKNCEKLYK